MKPLSEALKHIAMNATEGEQKQNMQVAGLKSADGRMTQPITQENPLITDREKLLSIQSLMRRMNQAPTIEWKEIIDDEGYPRMRRIETRTPVDITAQERELLSELSKPVSRKVVAYHITRLASHKRTQDDPKMMHLVIKDFTDYIYNEQPKEYELYSAIDYFISKDHSPFFPPLSQVMDSIKMAKSQGYVDSLK